MPNENLKDAIQDAGLTLEAFAEVIQVDPKTVSRWVAGTTTPYRRHRAAISSALNLTEQDLWPNDRTNPADNTPMGQAAGACDVTGTWAHADDNNAPDVLSFIQRTTGPIDVLDSCCGIPITTKITDALLARADAGRHVRVLADGQAPRWEPLLEHPHAEVYLAEIPGEYWLIKTENQMLLTINLEHQPDGGPPPPILELTATLDEGLFARLTSRFEELWELTKLPEPPAIADAATGPSPLENEPTPKPAAQPTSRRWPGRADR